MDVENNECVIAVTWHKEAIKKIKEWANGQEYSCLFSFVDSRVNGRTTILLAPSGSKKGWNIDVEVEKLRNDFIIQMGIIGQEIGYNPFKWVEVGFGEFGQKILRGNNKNQYSDKEYEK